MTDLHIQPGSSRSKRQSGAPRIVLVTGGSRSGKSRYAQALAESLPGPRLFVATCPVVDDEMAARIERHRADRRGKGWWTVEEGLVLARVLERETGFGAVLVDCLTLWVNNLLFQATECKEPFSEDQIARLCAGVLDVCAANAATTIFVTNELGMGVVPPDPLSRHYRDLVGRCNQTMAEGADRVVLLTAGIPITLKPGRS